MTTPFEHITEQTEIGQGFLPLLNRYTLHTASLASLFILRPPDLTNEDIQANVNMAREALSALAPEGGLLPPTTATTQKSIKAFLKNSRTALTTIEAAYPGTTPITIDTEPIPEIKALFRHQWLLLSALDIELFDIPPNHTDAGKHA